MRLPLRSTPRLTHVDSAIFTLRYFGACMQCTFCHDWCCQFGCDADLGERDRILAVKDELSRFVRVPADQWFDDEICADPELPTGKYVRTRAVKGACAFKSRDGRGCALHRFCLATGRDYHSLKPTVCWLFPVTFDQGVLQPADEVRAELVCAGTGVTLYAATREELRHEFGDALIHELDAHQAALASRVQPKTSEAR